MICIATLRSNSHSSKYFPDRIREVWSRNSKTGSETPLAGGV